MLELLVMALIEELRPEEVENVVVVASVVRLFRLQDEGVVSSRGEGGRGRGGR